MARLEKTAPTARSVNFYGCTETPQAMAYFLVPRIAGDAVSAAVKPTVPLGVGIQDVQLLVLNGAGQPAGVGELGEIYVRTHYLSKGYIGEKALTQERFLDNPFLSCAGDRLYRTGDLGRYLPAGDVEFFGPLTGKLKFAVTGSSWEKSRPRSAHFVGAGGCRHWPGKSLPVLRNLWPTSSRPRR